MKEFDQTSYESFLLRLKKEGVSIPQMVDLYGINERTAYRWVRYAIDDGWDVVKRGRNPTLYKVAI